MGREEQMSFWLDLGSMAYAPSFAIQKQILQARMRAQFPTTIILQENLPVFTVGRSGSRANILLSDEELLRHGIEVLDVDRGGDVTYHGPGQLIVSPVFYLGDIGLNANQYLHTLEDVLVDLLSHYGIHAGIKEGYPGVWWQDAKIGAVGIAVKHGFTFHGFSLNADLDMAPFKMINPCGVSCMPVTSIKQVLGHELPMSDIKSQLRVIMEQRFTLNTQVVSLPDFLSRLKTWRLDFNPTS
jgi:lipoate-protein ligase B